MISLHRYELEERKQVIKIFNFFNFLFEAQKSGRWELESLDEKYPDFNLKNSMKLNWLYYELSKLNCFSKHRDSKWSYIYDFLIEISNSKSIVSGDLYEELISENLRELSYMDLREKSRTWVKHCQNKVINKDFYHLSSLARI